MGSSTVMQYLKSAFLFFGICSEFEQMPWGGGGNRRFLKYEAQLALVLGML